MHAAVQAPCPGCQRVLRIPADWVGKPMRCKFCGTIAQAQRKTTQAAGVPMAGAVPTAEAVPPAAYPQAYPPPGYGYGPAPNAAPAGGQGGHPHGNGYPPAYAVAYPPPAVQPPADFTGGAHAAAFEDAGARHKGRGRYKGPSSGKGQLIAVGGITLVLTAGAVVLLARPDLFSSNAEIPKQVVNVEEKEKPKVEAPPAKATGPFPRRMLAVSISNYLYANPVLYGDSRHKNEADRKDVHTVVTKFSDRWRIPRDQVYELTDGPTEVGVMEGKSAVNCPPPLKPVIQQTIARFFDTCRAQDRIIFLFTGHAVEKDGEVYLVPLEGELEEIESLIPLKEVYAGLGKCKAQEKLVIWDVCRFSPSFGTERPAFGVMTEAMEKALHSPPPGVSVWTACSKGQYSYEGNLVNADIGMFMGHFIRAAADGRFSKTGKIGGGGIMYPDEPLPIAPLEQFVSRETADFSKRQQTPKFTAATEQRAVPYDPKEALAAKVEFPPAPPTADPAEVASIFSEIRFPPVKAIRKDLPEPKLDASVGFSAEAMKDYKADDVTVDEIMKDPKKYPLRHAVLEVIRDLRQMHEDSKGEELDEDFSGTNNDEAKKRILAIQRTPAIREAALTIMKEKLDLVADKRDQEKSKRWKAHYDYLTAQIKLRIAYISEYNLALGKVRKDELPEAAANNRGYRLAASTKMKCPKEVRDLVDEAKETLSSLAKENPGRPGHFSVNENVTSPSDSTGNPRVATTARRNQTDPIRQDRARSRRGAAVLPLDCRARRANNTTIVPPNHAPCRRLNLCLARSSLPPLPPPPCRLLLKPSRASTSRPAPVTCTLGPASPTPTPALPARMASWRGRSKRAPAAR